jgi:hypothetical protein
LKANSASPATLVNLGVNTKLTGGSAVHINMTKFAVHFAVVVPFIGDASLKGAVRDFTEEAKNEGAEPVEIGGSAGQCAT